MCRMLLSINPEHVNNILQGNKRVEFRKVKNKIDVEQIVIYSTAPVMQVVAEATVEEVIIGDVLEVWRLTKAFAGITYDYYREYYRGKDTAIAYKLCNVTPYSKPRSLSDFGILHPPQSFQYLAAATI